MKGVPLYVRVYTKEHTSIFIPVHVKMRNKAFEKLQSAMNISPMNISPGSKITIHIPKSEVLFPIDAASNIAGATKDKIDWYSEYEDNGFGINRYDILKEMLYEMDDYQLKIVVSRTRWGKTKIVWEVSI